METCSVLVTGAGGFIGSHTIDVLYQKGHEITATDRPGVELNPYTKADKNLIDYFYADLVQKKDFDRRLEKIDWVIHAGAIYDYDAPRDLLSKVNVGGTKNLMEVAKKQGVQRAVIFSSASVYGPLKELPCIEEYPKNPSGNYPNSKLAQERIGMSFRDSDFEVLIMRPTAVYGARSRYGTGNVIMSMGNRKWRKRLLGKLKPRRNVDIHIANVRDVARAAVHLAENGESGKAYNIADKTTMKIWDVLDLVAKEVGVRKPFLKVSKRTTELISRFGERIPEDTLSYFFESHVYSTKKLRQSGFEWEVKSTENGIKTMIGWYKEHGFII